MGVLGTMTGRLLLAAGVLAGLAALPAAADAGVMTLSGAGSNEGRPVSATAKVTTGDGFVEIILTNTTLRTYGAAQLLTGFQFELDPEQLTELDLVEASTPFARWVFADGTVDDGVAASPVNLLDPVWTTPTSLSLTTKSKKASILKAGSTWGLQDGDVSQLDFHPDAKFAIVGVAEESDTRYLFANGSISGNTGHNPFAMHTATFRLEASGITENTRIANAVFLFGTDFGGQIHVVPLPSSAWAGLGLLGVLGYVHARRRRRELD